MLAQSPPDRPSDRPARRAFPWLLVAVLAAKAAALAWLAYFGFPREWGDVVFFKQPAYMALHTGAFSLPTAIGYRPFADITYAAYPPLYTYASLLVFKLFGFSVRSSLAFDLGVHLLLTGLIGWLLWRKTRSGIVAGLFVLLSTGLLLPEGRPDELAVLLALLAVMAVARRRYVPAALLLGLSLATQPTQAILGAILCLAVDLTAAGFRPRFVGRAAAMAAGAAAACVVVWLPAVLPHLRESAAQFVAHSTDRWALNLGELFGRDPVWAAFWVFIVAFVAGCGVFLALRPPEALRRGAEDGTLLRGILLAMPPSIGFLLAIASPYYGYRLLNVLYLAAAFYLAYVLFGAASRPMKTKRSTLSGVEGAAMFRAVFHAAGGATADENAPSRSVIGGPAVSDGRVTDPPGAIFRADSHAGSGATADENARSNDFSRSAWPAAIEVATTNRAIFRAAGETTPAQISASSVEPSKGADTLSATPHASTLARVLLRASARLAPLRYLGQWTTVRKTLAAAAFAGIVLLSAGMNYNIVRFILAPLTWDANNVTYDEAIAAVRAVVPPDATVGGDSTIWWAIADGRPFYSLSWYQGEPWPEYILSTAFWGKGGKPAVLQRQAWADRIAAEYVEVTPAGPLAGACALPLLGREVPLSRSGGGCDWHVQIWKRK